MQSRLASTEKPTVTVTPIMAPTTTAALSGTTSGSDWYTSTVTVTLTAQGGKYGVGKTLFAPWAGTPARPYGRQQRQCSSGRL